MRLKDKVAIITGGAGGIGMGMATAYVKEGAKVVIVDMNKEMGEAALEKLKAHSDDVRFMQADLSQHDKLAELVENVVKEFGSIDILVNNAHASRQNLFELTTKEDMDLSFNTGFYPTFYLMQAVFPYMKENGGKVINFASGAGINGDPTQVSYAAAKEAIRAITRVAANEWGKYGININLISPIAKTPGVEHWANEHPDYYEAMLDKIPLGRLGDPEEDIGRVAVFLASEDSNYISGQTIMVDGGSTKVR